MSVADLLDDKAEVIEASKNLVALPTRPQSVLRKQSESDLSFTLSKQVLQLLFEKASVVVPTKDLFPVLKNFWVEVKDSSLMVVATDLELSVQGVTTEVSVLRPGLAVFPAKKMLEILREADDGLILIDVVKGKATISIGPTQWTLRLESGEDFPPLPFLGSVSYFEINRLKFLSAINSVQYAVSTNVNYQHLMMIDIDGGKMTATDGSRIQQTLIGDDFTISIQIPVGAVSDLVKLLRGSPLETIEVGDSENHIVFQMGFDALIVNKLTAQFPDVETLLLRPALMNQTELLVDKAELEGAIKRVKINVDVDTSAIIMRMDKNQVTIGTKDKLGNTSIEKIVAEWSASPHTVVVNYKFLLDMLVMYEGKVCKFLFGEDTKSRKSPILLKDDETVGVIQQMRTVI